MADQPNDHKRLIGLAAVLCLASSAYALTEEEEVLQKSPEKARLFVASYFTSTFTAISTFTTVEPFQCFFTSAGVQACTGRKLRRMRKLSVDIDGSSDSGLSPSEGGASVMQSEDKDTPAEKFFFTVWKTNTSTATVTTTSINSSITISASAYCTFSGFTGPLC
ncbi:uncharacterized protein LOC125040570 [Penaeus chinensis]|uniref:uncharacterized protein LOC125040570 n=1 Tax=Penaeus chinensis TaxID=139456 RepID=UPI001FB72767|nr:uncharacterized protein LOC125040570 [Penaeus chinensis]